MKFTIPGEPQGKGRPRFVSTPHGGRTYTDPKTAGYENSVRVFARQAGVKLFEGPVEVTIGAYLEIPTSASAKRKAAMLEQEDRPTKKPDADNIAKAIMDGLTGLAWKDDTQVVVLKVYKFWASEPRVTVELEAA